jgi:hypothetical protein
MILEETDMQSEKRTISDSGRGEEVVFVTRYKGSKAIGEMIEKGQPIEAFAHAQLHIEKILWDRIVGVFSGQKNMEVRREIDKIQKKHITRTSELIKWAHILGAINQDEYGDLVDFNKARNRLMHSHGEWYFSDKHRQALKKGIRFIERSEQ